MKNNRYGLHAGRGDPPALCGVRGHPPWMFSSRGDPPEVSQTRGHPPEVQNKGNFSFIDELIFSVLWCLNEPYGRSMSE